MNVMKAKHKRRDRRKAGIRKRVIGTAERPRLTVYRSLNHIYAQVIDDLAGHTLVAASTRDKGVATGSTGNKAAASAIGKVIAERAKAAGVTQVVFDRNGFRYHGRIRALAEAAREGGLKF